jgi:hypothetical protein
MSLAALNRKAREYGWVIRAKPPFGPGARLYQVKRFGSAFCWDSREPGYISPETCLEVAKQDYARRMKISDERKARAFVPF